MPADAVTLLAGGRIFVSPATVLVVEDEAIVRKDIVKTLETMQYNPLSVASTGDEAVVNAREYSPDVVLMDINIPGTMNGLEAAGVIRDELDIPVIFVTSFSDDATIESAKQVNPYGYVLKPFTGRDLKVAIEIALSRKAAETSGGIPNIPAVSPGIPQTLGDNSGEYSSLSDIRTLMIEDFFKDVVLLLYNNVQLKELILSSFLERSMKTGGNLLFAYSLSKAHKKFQNEIRQGMIKTCRMKTRDIFSLKKALSAIQDPEGSKEPVPLRVIIDFSDMFTPDDIMAIVDQIVAIRKTGVPLCGIIALFVGPGDDVLIKTLSQSIPKVVVTTTRGTIISCADHSYPLEHLAFLPQPVVDEIVKKVLEPVVLSFLEKPVSGYDILQGIYERYNVAVPKARIYMQLYALEKKGYLSMSISGKSKIYSPTETGKIHIRQKLQEFNSVFHHILSEILEQDTGIREKKT